MTMMQRWLAIVLGALLLSLFHTQSGFAQSGEELKGLRQDIQELKETQTLRNEVQALKDGQTAMQKDLQEIKTLLQQVRQAPAAAAAPTQPQNVVLSTDGNAIKGDKNAKLTLIEFTDYQCPFCSRHFREAYSEIDKEYIKTGKVKYVLREFPLESIHPQAFKASEAAQCAGEQQKYWEMHDRLFADQKLLGISELPKHAAALGLDVPKFQQCLDSSKYAKMIRKDMADGQKAGVTGTPSFFLGLMQPDGSVKVQNTLKGAQPYTAFKQAIDDLLALQK